jgi:glycerophosphoryl diester phosphodiesterase
MKKLIKILMWILIPIASIVLVITILNIIPWTFSSVPGENNWRQYDKPPLVIPHGGAKRLAPENTIYAYDQLVNVFEADVLEIDLSLTSEGELITHHDLFLSFSPEFEEGLESLLIRNYSYAQIVQMYKDDDYYLARTFVNPDGVKEFENESDQDILDQMVPALIADIFDVVGNKVKYILEIKDSPTSEGYVEGLHDYQKAADELIRLVELYDLEDDVVLASFDDTVINYFKEKRPNIKVNAGMGEVLIFSVLSAFHIDFFASVKSEVFILPDPTSMSVPSGYVGIVDLLPGMFRDNIAKKDDDGNYMVNIMHKQIIDDLHRKNIAVLYWTVNDKETMKLLIEYGVDGIITDRPDLLIEVFDELGIEH